jgi:3-hydroxymyristoyl/3-hydroxydecanoyl-(acyl carrier protein) dehydratase
MQFSVPHDHPCLAGHFPGRPLVPGVVLLERVLEAIELGHGPVCRLRVPQVKFLQPLLPGRPAQVVVDGAAPRWRFEVRGEAGVLARGEVVADG